MAPPLSAPRKISSEKITEINESIEKLININGADVANGIYARELLVVMRRFEKLFSRTKFPLSIEQIGIHGLKRVWKPEGWTKRPMSLRDKVFSLLNKVTPTTQGWFTQEFISYNVSSDVNQLAQVVKLIFEKAARDPIYSPLYAEICKAQVDEEPKQSPFKFALLDRVVFVLLEEIEEISDECDEKHEERIAFVGHLYRNRLLSASVLNILMIELLKSSILFRKDAMGGRIISSVPRVLKLINTIGDVLDTSDHTHEMLSDWLNCLNGIVNSLPVTMRCDVEHVNILRRLNWVSEDKLKPQTIDNHRLSKMCKRRFKCKNPWKPSRLKFVVTPEEHVSGTVLSLLNKVSRTTLDRLSDEFLSVNISEEQLEKIAKTIFDKAAQDRAHSHLYAILCSTQTKLNTALANYSQEFIEDNKEIDENLNMREAMLTEKKRESKLRKLGGMAFIGHLYRNQALSLSMIYRFLNKLLLSKSADRKWNRKNIDEESVYCGFKIIETIGDYVDQIRPQDLDRWIERLEKAQSFCTIRLRCLISNLVKLRANNWIPFVPKTDTSTYVKQPWMPHWQKILFGHDQPIEEQNRRDRIVFKPKNLREEKSIPDEKAALIEVRNEVCSLLNKITFSNKQEIIQQFLKLNVSSNDKQLHQVMNMIFNRAFKEPLYSQLYADLCKQQVNKESKDSPFRKTINSFFVPQFLERRVYDKSAVFVGHLYRHQLITKHYFHRSYGKLFASIIPTAAKPLSKETIDEEYVYRGLELLEKVGKYLDTTEKSFMNDHCQKMKAAIPFCSTRLRIMFINFLRLRTNKWVRRHAINEKLRIVTEDERKCRQTKRKPSQKSVSPSNSGSLSQVVEKKNTTTSRRNPKTQVAQKSKPSANKNQKSNISQQAPRSNGGKTNNRKM